MNTNSGELIEKIIPPNDITHRLDFRNDVIIDKLTESEKLLVEQSLIEMLSDSKDTLIIETLAYLRSHKAIPAIENVLNRCTRDIDKIVIAASIFTINQDEGMADVALQALAGIKNNYLLVLAFYFLSKIKNVKIKSVIEEYTHHPDYLVAYNAKRAFKEI